VNKLDTERLVKFLGMSDSSSDGEALTAMRMANKLLREAEVTWRDVITDPRVAERQVFEAFVHQKTRTHAARYGRPLRAKRHNPNEGRHTDSDIPEMLTALRQRRHEMGFLMFLAGVTEQYRRVGYLTTSQLNAVRAAYQRRG